MKSRHLFTVLSAIGICLTSLCSLSGCSLALEEEPPAAGEDFLAGVFVTETYIEPAAPQLEVNTKGEIYAIDTGADKRYGSFTGYDKDAPVVTFPNLSGYGVYSLQAPEDASHEAAGYNSCDYGFTDLHFSVSDEEESMEASLYVSTGGSRQYYFNPVYQQADGQLYLLPGSGISTDAFVDGQKFSQSITHSVSQTENGVQTSRSLRFTINIIAADPPVSTELFLMDGGNQIIGTYSGQQLEAFQESGEALVLPAEVSYLILRQSLAEPGNERHVLFDRGAEYLEYMTSTPSTGKTLLFCQLPLEWR